MVPPPRSTGGRRWRNLLDPRGDIPVALLLFVAALAVRRPYLMRLPHFTDETVEVRLAIAIWRGEVFPLTAADPYYGPLHAYLVAACLWLLGPSMVLPRAMVMVLGAATVVATYSLGKALAGRAAGLLAAALLVTAPQHVVVNSHVGWQNCTTPFYTTVCCWALVRALACLRADPARAGAGGGYLVLAGWFFGLSLQSHPGTLVLGPGLVATYLHALLRGRSWRWLRQPWPWAGVAAALVSYSPVLAYNLAHGLIGVRRVQQRRTYAFVLDPSWASYLDNLTNLLLALARLISNPMRIPERPAHYLTSPYLVAMVGLCGLGLFLLARREQWLPLFALLSTALVMPRFNRAYGGANADQIGDRYLLSGRYLAFLLPLLETAIAVGVLALAAWVLGRRWTRGAGWRRPTAQRIAPTSSLARAAARAAISAAAGVFLALLVLYPLQPLARYYTHEAEKDPTNASFLETVRVVNAHRGPRTPVWLDRYFDKVLMKDGVEALDVLDYLLILDGVPHRIVDDFAGALLDAIPALGPDDPESYPIVVTTRDRCWHVRDELPLQRLSHTLILNELYRYYGVYRYAPPPQPARCLPAEQGGG